MVAIGYPKFAGELGGYARFIAICPADWKYGISVGEVAVAPLPKSDKILQWDAKRGIKGYRGRPPADVAAISEILLRGSRAETRSQGSIGARRSHRSGDARVNKKFAVQSPASDQERIDHFRAILQRHRSAKEFRSQTN
jgi:hypothetical protein